MCNKGVELFPPVGFVWGDSPRVEWRPTAHLAANRRDSNHRHHSGKVGHHHGIPFLPLLAPNVVDVNVVVVVVVV